MPCKDRQKVRKQMQIVIDIPEEDFERCKKKYQMRIDIMGNAIAKGISLPKGHGRLIDADEIQFENNEFDTYSDYSRAFDAIDQADAIIEADEVKE